MAPSPPCLLALGLPAPRARRLTAPRWLPRGGKARPAPGASLGASLLAARIRNPMTQGCPDSSQSGRRQRWADQGLTAGSSQTEHACAGPACFAPRPKEPSNAHACETLPTRTREAVLPGSAPRRGACAVLPCASRVPGAARLLQVREPTSLTCAPHRVAPGPATARSFRSVHAGCLRPRAVRDLHEEFRGLRNCS